MEMGLYFFFIAQAFERLRMHFTLVRIIGLGLDIRGRLVQHVVSVGRLDVHGIHPELVRHFSGPLRCSHEAHNVPQHHVSFQSQAPNRWPLGAQFCHLLSTTGRLERHKGKLDATHLFSYC